MLNDGYSKTINFLECHTRVFNDKMNEINEIFLLIMYRIVILFTCMVF